MSVYLLNGVPVNDRVDWRHRVIPGPAPMREVGFPGDPNRFMLVTVERPPDIVIAGYLQAANIVQLNGLLKTYSALRTSTSLSTVSMHGDAYPHCHLMEVEFLDKISPCSVGVMRLTRFLWRQLQWA